MVTSLREIVGIIGVFSVHKLLELIHSIFVTPPGFFLAGCAVCALLYAAPILTFKRVIKKASVEEFSCIPYILALFSALIYTWYSIPVVSSGWENLSLCSVCILGVLFETTFVSIYIWFSPREKKKLAVLMVSLILIFFGMTVFFSSFSIHTQHTRKVFVGSIGLVTSISMYSSPLVAVKQVMRTKSVEFMPFYLSLFTFLSGLSWMAYGLLGRDPFVTAPNSVGCLMGILQMIVYFIYSKCNEVPKKLHDIEQANVRKVANCQLDTKGQSP